MLQVQQIELEGIRRGASTDASMDIGFVAGPGLELLSSSWVTCA